jgi:hypothetical protein
MKIAGAVVPPCVPLGFWVMQTVRIDESYAQQPRERLPLAIGHVVPP